MDPVSPTSLAPGCCQIVGNNLILLWHLQEESSEGEASAVDFKDFQQLHFTGPYYVADKQTGVRACSVSSLHQGLHQAIADMAMHGSKGIASMLEAA